MRMWLELSVEVKAAARYMVLALVVTKAGAVVSAFEGMTKSPV